MLIFIHTAPHFYVGLMGGISRIKRTIPLDSNFKDLNPQTENSKNHFEGSLHVGLIKSIKEKYFVGIEWFVGRSFGEDFFKPQMNIGVKALVGFNVNNKIRLYTGAGVNFIRIKSLKIQLNGEIFNFTPIDPTHYEMFHLFLGNIGAEFFVRKNISIRIEGGIAISKTFDNNMAHRVLYHKKLIINNKASEKYHLFKTTLGLFYHGKLSENFRFY